MTATLDTYRIQAEELGSNAYLGRLFWYSLSNVRIPHDKMIQMLHTCGITKNLPLPPTDVDVFKRVASSVKRTKIGWGEEQYANYLMREFRDDDTVTRRIVREIVDSKGKRLEFTEMADITFTRKDSSLQFQSMPSKFSLDTVVHEMWEEVEQGFAHWRDCLNLYGVRQWVRGFIVNLGATMVRDGGAIYFIAEEHVDRVEALERFGALINSEQCGQVDFHSLPLLDDGKQRDMVRRAFEAETSDAIDKMLVEIAEFGDSKITADKYAGILSKYQSIVARTKDYEVLLEDTLANTGTRLNIFQKALLNLRMNVRED